MRINKNKRFFPQRNFQFTPDGRAKNLPVDQFPVQPFNRNKFGWPKSDITILDELSRSRDVDISLYTAFASRLNVLRQEKGVRINLTEVNGELTAESKEQIDLLIQQYHPHWIQTVTEERDFAQWYYENYDNVSVTNNETNDEDNENNSTVDDVSSGTNNG